VERAPCVDDGEQLVGVGRNVVNGHEAGSALHAIAIEQIEVARNRRAARESTVPGRTGTDGGVDRTDVLGAAAPIRSGRVHDPVRVEDFEGTVVDDQHEAV
jgi:hypothetical protein